MQSRASAHDYITRRQEPASELDVGSQLDYACSLVGGRTVIVRGNTSGSKTRTLNKGREAWVAIVVTSTARTRLQVGMIEDVQHLRLKGKRDAFPDGKA